MSETLIFLSDVVSLQSSLNDPILILIGHNWILMSFFKRQGWRAGESGKRSSPSNSSICTSPSFFSLPPPILSCPREPFFWDDKPSLIVNHFIVHSRGSFSDESRRSGERRISSPPSSPPLPCPCWDCCVFSFREFLPLCCWYLSKIYCLPLFHPWT